MEAVIAAGRTGLMTVSPALAADLALDMRGTGRATLAGGGKVNFPASGAAVQWDDRPTCVEADAADTPL